MRWKDGLTPNYLMETIQQASPQFEFARSLKHLGFSHIFEEFPCCGSEHPFVDVAAKIGYYYWGFEYKSPTDSVQRGFAQVASYSDWFDYVVLVSERLLDHRNFSYYDSATRHGYGIWFFGRPNRILAVSNPRIQRPNQRRRKYVRNLMRRLSRPEPRNSHSVLGSSHRQTSLTQFLVEDTTNNETDEIFSQDVFCSQ